MEEPNQWDTILVKGSNLLPDFNDDLLVNFRPRKLAEIPQYIDDVLRESTKMFDGKLKYIGYKQLDPDENLEYIRTNPILKRKIDINKSTFTRYQLNYEFQGAVYPMYIETPYLENNAIYVADTQYYPLLPIIEKGGLHRTQKEVIIKVMRAPLTFKRETIYTFTTSKNKVCRETVITVKIHQRKQGRGNKRSDRTPLLLYHLVNLSFDKTMLYYGFNPGEISLVSSIREDEKDISYIKIRDDVYLRVLDIALTDMFKRRTIASYLMCLDEHPKFSIRDLVAQHPVYYKTVLGKYTYPSNTNAQLLYDNAEKHLDTTKSLLDPTAQYQLASIGIEADDIYHLLYLVFFNLDKWIVGYNPNDLFNKKIGALDQITAPLVMHIITKSYALVNNKNEGFTHDAIKRFTTSATQGAGWLVGNQMLRANPTIVNDNSMLSVLTKRFRTHESIESKSSPTKGGRNMPVSSLLAHYSQLLVESILAQPSSSPIITGEINPFLKIDLDGAIIKPKDAVKYENIFN